MTHRPAAADRRAVNQGKEGEGERKEGRVEASEDEKASEKSRGGERKQKKAHCRRSAAEQWRGGERSEKRRRGEEEKRRRGPVERVRRPQRRDGGEGEGVKAREFALRPQEVQRRRGRRGRMLRAVLMRRR
jgi:hypothetical protein